MTNPTVNPEINPPMSPTAQGGNELVNHNNTNNPAASASQKRNFLVPTNKNKKQRTDDIEANDDDGHTPEDTPMKDSTEDEVVVVDYTDILERNISNILDRENTSKKTAMTIKLRFRPATQFKASGNANKVIENPILGHLRKVMKHCLEITGGTVVFRTFTSGHEFDLKHCLSSDREAEQELLASSQPYQKFTHVMMLRVELITRVSQFKGDLLPWARKNDTMILEHSYPKKEIETVRIGFIHGKHPVDTYRTDYQEELNIRINADVNKLTKAERMKIIEEETGDVEGTIPCIRLINHYLSWVLNRKKIESRGLVVECLKVDKLYVLKRLQKIFGTKSDFSFVPFSLPFSKNIMGAGEKYFNLVKSHKERVDNLVTLPILGLSVKQMTEVTDEHISIREELLESGHIEAVERTPGTTRVGKWNLIVKKKQRAAAEKAFDGLIMWRFAEQIKEDKDFKKPFRAQVTIPVDYIDQVIEDQSTKSQDTNNISAMTSSHLENRMDGIVAKCDETVDKCTNMLEKIDTQSKQHFEKVCEDFNKERDDFRVFLNTMMEKNDQKFTELYEFKNQQEFINHQIETEIGLLKQEVRHIKQQATRKEAEIEDWKNQISQDIDDLALSDEEMEDSSIHSNPQGEDSIRAKRATGNKKTKKHSERYHLSKKRTTKKKTLAAATATTASTWSEDENSKSLSKQE